MLDRAAVDRADLLARVLALAVEELAGELELLAAHAVRALVQALVDSPASYRPCRNACTRSVCRSSVVRMKSSLAMSRVCSTGCHAADRVAAGPADPRRHQRRLHPHDAGAAHRPGPALPAGPVRRRRDLRRSVRGPVLRALRGVQAPRRAAGRRGRVRRPWSARSTAVPVEQLSERNWFFRLSKYSDAILDHYAAHPDAVEPASARNEVLSFVRQGLDDLSISRSSFDWGIPVPWDPDQVVYVWFDALLNYATAVGLGDTESRAPPVRDHVPGRRAPGRQGHPSVPRGDLAGDAARCRAAVATQGVRARVAARRRGEDEQVQAHRHRARAGRRPLRLRRVPLLLPARDPVRLGRLVLVGGHERALHRRAGRTASATSPRGWRPWWAGTRDGVLPAAGPSGPAEEPSPPPPSGDRAGRRPGRRAGLLRRHRGGLGRSSTRSTATSPSSSPGSSPSTPAGRARLDTVLGTAAEGLRVLAVLLNPLMPKACAALWDSLGAEAALGALADQPLADAGRWGQLPAGVVVTKGAVLFPRLEDADPAAMAEPLRERPPAGRTRDRTFPPAPEPLRTPVLDSHCHLDIRDGEAWMDVDDALAAATAAGVPRIVQIGCDLPGARWAVDVAATAPRHRGRRRAAPERGAADRAEHGRVPSTTPGTRSTRSPRTTACAPSARPASTTSARPTRRARGAGGVVPPAHRDRACARQAAGHPRPRRARGRAARAGRRRRTAHGRASTASAVTSRWHARASTTDGCCRSPAP